jgi:hypothetical protein
LTEDKKDDNDDCSYVFKRISIRINNKDYWILKKALAENKITLHDAILLGLNSYLHLELKIKET